ncbi:hypothetical protein [Microbacterium sp. E-13]|uniref:hypothetical protein n=1 Tax=Microbacterium sp. E-13 TaxID=3404048 RepID=UPI003CE67AAD
MRLQSLPIGAPALAGRWKIELGAVAWAQRDEILAANVAPAPLPEDYGWALLPITFVNLSDEAATPGQFEVILHAGGWDVSHREVGRFLTRMPAEFHPTELEPNASITGNLGFWLPDAATADPKCRIELHTMTGGYGSDPQVFWFTCS